MDAIIDAGIRLLVGGGLVGLVGFSLYTIVAAPSATERFRRSVGLLGGFLIYGAARALGLAVPELLLRSIQGFGLSAIAFGVVGPILAGWYVGKYIQWAIDRDESGMVEARFLVLMTGILLSGYSDVLAAALQLPEDVDRRLLPNSTFLIGWVLYVVTRRKGSSSVAPDFGRPKRGTLEDVFREDEPVEETPGLIQRAQQAWGKIGELVSRLRSRQSGQLGRGDPSRNDRRQ